jgi:hypothetical protein
MICGKGKVQAQTLDNLQTSLQLAVCFNDWEQAVRLTGVLIASTDITSAYRNELVTFRHQLEALRAEAAIVPDIPGCSSALAQTVQTTTPTDQPLDWENAVSSAGGNPVGQSPEAYPGLEQSPALALDAAVNLPALYPAMSIDTRSGAGVVGGDVRQGEAIYSFWGGLGDRVTLRVDVNQIAPGVLYTDDDSQLFLFDAQGKLLAENDDFTRLQSQITDFLLPQTGQYYLVVTTYNNDPILDTERRVTGWSGNGGSAIEFTVSATGLTPSEQLILRRPAP